MDINTLFSITPFITIAMRCGSHLVRSNHIMIVLLQLVHSRHHYKLKVKCGAHLVSIKSYLDHPSTCSFSSSLWMLWLLLCAAHLLCKSFARSFSSSFWRLWLLICEAHLVCNCATVRSANYISPFLSVLKKVKADISTDKGICISLGNFCWFLTIFFLTDWPSSTPLLFILKKVTANISTDKGQNLAQDPS